MFIFRIPEQSKYFNGRASNFIISWHCHEYCFVFYRPIRTSEQNWNCLDKIEGQILSWQIFVFQSGQILSTILIIFLCRARQNIEHFGGIMVTLKFSYLWHFFVLLNLAQITGETLLMAWWAGFYGINFFEPSCPFNGWTL